MHERYYPAYRLRGVLMAPPVAFILLSHLGEIESDWLIFPPGIMIVLAGVLLRLWAQVHLHYRLKVPKTLTRTGPYGIVRNPIYIGNTLMLLGLCAMCELVWFLPVLALYCAVVYSAVVRYEEAHLLAKYGAPYREYLGTVPRWIPRMRAASQVPAIKARDFLLPSIAAEMHCVLLPLLAMLKEVHIA